MLSERLLHFIWQFQYFNKNGLATSEGESLQLLAQGTYNRNQGPDFSEAKIKIGNTLWAGNIELHINASDWRLHRHHKDPHYNNVILHVVWNNDVSITDAHGIQLPTLHLQPLVPALMLTHFEKLMQSAAFVPCASYLPVLSELGWQNWQERLLVERLEQRAALILQKLALSGNHWEEVFWHLLAKNFGMPVNGEAFENMAQSIPLTILAKHKHSIHQLEALLLGQAGLLAETVDAPYALLLQREYRFLQTKYQLAPANVKPAFLRMRPANFPTVRLAQLAMLICQSEHLFSKIIECESGEAVSKLLNVTANDFWHYHYRLTDETAYHPKTLGRQMTDNIIINTVVPVVFAYGVYGGRQLYKDKAVEWLSQTASEKNNITKAWQQHGVNSYNAMQTQGLLQLKKQYCDNKRCLDCAVGTKVLKAAAL